MRQGLQPLKSDLAISIDAAQRDGVGRGWKGHVHLGDPGRDLNLLISGGADGAVARVDGDPAAIERGIGTDLGTVRHALGGTGVPYAQQVKCWHSARRT